MQKIIPFLWFDNNAEEAVKFYTSIFKNSKSIDITHYGESAAEVSGRPKGTVMTVTFELEGQRFMALNGGPVFNFSPAISFLVNRETQEELDELVGKTLRWRTKRAVWMVERQVWCFMADRSYCLGRDVARQRYREIGKSHKGTASNEENRNRERG